MLSRLLSDFLNSERAGGFVLIGCTVISMAVANLAPAYGGFWDMEIGGLSIAYWINDGLMTVFFFLIGLELEREIYSGELSNISNALFPVFAAVGGMAMPAALYFFVNQAGGDLRGIGIPMATDIAFALAVLSLLGSRVPDSLKVFLTALAIIDDLGAILIIALFYSGGIEFQNLMTALGIFTVMLVLNRLRVHRIWPYVLGGLVMWYFMLNSGIHATITGVLVAFALPFGDGGTASPSYNVQHALHRPVAFVILPLFALANTAIVVDSESFSTITTAVGLGIIAGLFIGKPVGIFVFSWLSAKLGFGKLPSDLKWSSIAATGILGGIGFTMSIFISILAFDERVEVDQAKIAVIVASLGSGVLGYLILNAVLPQKLNTGG